MVRFLLLQTLHEAQEKAIAAGQQVVPNPRIQELRATYVGDIADLCEIKALKIAGVQVPQALDKRFPLLPSFVSLVRPISELAIEKSTAISRYQKLTNQSEWWFIDIVSDANGVSFHRFQLFAWTVILGGVFILATYRELNMPVFDTTLMGLLGLSAATYLGLKIPEATIPSK